MDGAGSSDHEIRADRERVSALCSAMLRIGATLDLDVVLQEVVDSARTLTSARYAIIVTVDEAGDIADYVTSGFTAEEKHTFAEWPDGPKLFAHLNGQPGPLRLANLPDYVRELGFSAELMRSNTLQAMPMRHRGERVGSFFLAEKADAAEFTAEDEELLALFAAQAAATIVHARAMHKEQRARADLEALVETSPVGVAVLDAKTGRPVSFNAAALRIAAPLLTPDAPPERTLEVLTCRFADGSGRRSSAWSATSCARRWPRSRAPQPPHSVPRSPRRMRS